MYTLTIRDNLKYVTRKYCSYQYLYTVTTNAFCRKAHNSVLHKEVCGCHCTVSWDHGNRLGLRLPARRSRLNFKFSGGSGRRLVAMTTSAVCGYPRYYLSVCLSNIHHPSATFTPSFSQRDYVYRTTVVILSPCSFSLVNVTGFFMIFLLRVASYVFRVRQVALYDQKDPGQALTNVFVLNRLVYYNYCRILSPYRLLSWVLG